MTPDNLASIMEKVPREAWPELCYMGDDAGWWFNRLAVTNHHVQPELAELACIGSMVQWLSDRGLSLVKPCSISSNPITANWWLCISSVHPSYEPTCMFFHHGLSLIEALAAACIAVAGKETL